MTRRLSAATTPLSFRDHLPGLDVLRGVAISMVLVYHGFDLRAPYAEFSGVTRVFVYLTSWGPTGVPLFFVLSGFLITGIVLDGRDRTHGDFGKSFYGRRALRILPAYLTMLVILKILGIVSWQFTLAATLFMANMPSLVGAGTGQYFTFWSLAVEEQFYVVWPWLVRGVDLRRLALLAVVVVIITLGVQLFAVGWLEHVDLRYKLWGNIPSLMAGALIAIGLRLEIIRRDTIGRYIAGCMLGVVATAPIIYVVDMDLLPTLGGLYRLPFILAFSALLLWVVARHRTDQRVSNRAGRVFAFLGYISYGLYLVHQLLFILYDRAFAGTRLMRRDFVGLGVEWLICVAASILIAFLSRQYFEAWFLRRVPRSLESHRHPALT